LLEKFEATEPWIPAFRRDDKGIVRVRTDTLESGKLKG
jgi:hypothetical protein